MSRDFPLIPEVPFEAIYLFKDRDEDGFETGRTDRKLKAVGNRADADPTSIQLSIIPESPMRNYNFYVVPSDRVENRTQIQLPRCKYEIFKKMRGGRTYQLGYGWWNKRQNGLEFIKCRFTDVAPKTDVKGTLILRQTTIRAKDFSADQPKKAERFTPKGYVSSADEYVPTDKQYPESLEEARQWAARAEQG